MTRSFVAAPGVNRKFSDRRRYEALMDVMLRRGTARVFDPSHVVGDAEYRLILEAARLAPSGANAQPWHFIVVTSAWTKHVIADYLCAEQARRRADGQKAELIDYRGVGSAPGFIVVVSDYRLTWAYPGLMDGTEIDQRYHANAERIILQGVAAATMSAHLAAASLGFQSWWVSVLGNEETQAAMHPLLGVPEDLTITDIMLFGPAAQVAAPRWKKRVEEVASWDRFDMANFRSVAQIDAWMDDLRSRSALARSPAKAIGVRREPPPTIDG